MLHIGQRVRVAENTPTDYTPLEKYRGEIGTVNELDIECERVGSGATTLCEYPGVLFPAQYLIPLDDDDAFERFMKKLDLDNPSYSPWTEKA